MVISTRSCKPRETRRSCHRFTETQSARRCGQCHSYSAAHANSGGAELLSRRLQQLRLDPEYMKVCYPSVHEELKRVCASCKFQRIRAQDLASGDVESGMRIYCPNAPVIDVDDVV